MLLLDTESIKERLEEKKKEIEEQIRINNKALEGALNGEGHNAYLDNCTSPASKRQRALSLAKCLLNINSALLRLESGNYGSCQDCGGYIEEKRLLANPEARRCLHCQDVSI